MLTRISPETKGLVRKQGDIAARIDEILKRKHLKQGDLARRVNMKKSQVSNILAGNANLTLRTITRLELALGEEIVRIPSSTVCIHTESIKMSLTALQISYSVHDADEEMTLSPSKVKDGFITKYVTLNSTGTA